MAPNQTLSEDIDLTRVTASDNPDEFWARVRQERPVFHDPEHDIWFVTRSDDVKQVLSDSAIFSSRHAFTSHMELPEPVLAILGEQQFMEQNPINLDPPDHTPIRHVWGRALMRREVSSLTPVLEMVADGLADFMSDDSSGPVDLMADFASPFPATVVLCALLGVNPSDVPDHISWGMAVATLLGSEAPVEELEAAARLHVQHLDYWSEQLELRRHSPRDDLLTAFVEESEAEEGLHLSPRALAYLPLALSAAGHVTTAQSIGFGVQLLLAHPELRARALADPAVMAHAVDEVLRYEAPAQMVRRTTTQEVEIRGVRIPAGARLMAVIGSANRDPDAYTVDPCAFDVDRDKPSAHLTFGRGPHYCLGAALARAELSVAFTTLFSRFPNMRLAPEDPIRRIEHLFHRGFERLKVDLGL